MIQLDILLLMLVWLGHFTLCVAIFNRLHAIRINRKLRRKLEIVLLLSWPVGVSYYLWQIVFGGLSLSQAAQHPTQSLAFLAFPVVCWLALLIALPCWLWPRLSNRRPVVLRSNHSTVVKVLKEVGRIDLHGRLTHWLAKFPGNEIFHLDLREKELTFATLPAKLDGFSIVHLSDLHFTGDIGQQYFDYVVDAANRMAGDVVMISGDIIEAVACEPWLTQTLGRLTARQGKYFVLGNHDLRMTNPTRIRELLTACGFIDLGGKVQIETWNACRVLLAGDERPWFAGPREEAIEQLSHEVLFRILVAHTPDRLPWAKQQRFDLMLAGHNHGGQVRFPFAGPLISPSLSGTRYSAGVFYEPPTVLHVSRGISGEHPIRWNCPPELAKLILRRG